MKSITVVIASLIAAASAAEEAAYIKFNDYSAVQNKLENLGYDEKTARQLAYTYIQSGALADIQAQAEAQAQAQA